MSSIDLPDFRYPFGRNMNILSEYDGIFLTALDEDTNILYVYENGDSNLGIPFRYWAVDLSFDACGDIMLLSRVLRGEERLRDLIIKGRVPARIVRVEGFEYGGNFAKFLKDEDARYIPVMVSENLTDLYR